MIRLVSISGLSTLLSARNFLVVSAAAPFKKYLGAVSHALLACSLLSACDSVDSGGKGSEPPDEFGFTPAYTEPRGTVHRGDFFPLTSGIQIPIAVTLTDTTNFSANGIDMGTPVNESGTKGTRNVFTGRVETLPARRVVLPSGAYTLAPEVTVLKGQSAGATESRDTLFYEKLATAVNMRARAPEGSAREEDDDPIFLKRLPLTVGDSWGYGETDSGITSKGRFYVTGMETITVGGRTLRALRIDQMGKSEGSYHDDGGATVVTYESEIHQIAWLAEGIGQVRQEWKSTGTSSRFTHDNNTSVTLSQATVRSMVMEITGESGPIR